MGLIEPRCPHSWRHKDLSDAILENVGWSNIRHEFSRLGKQELKRLTQNAPILRGHQGQNSLSSGIMKLDDPPLGMNVFAAILDEANYNPRAGVLPVGAPIRHRDLPDVVGVIRSSFRENYQWWYVVDWLVEGFAPQAREDWIRELPSAMHLLASV